MNGSTWQGLFVVFFASTLLFSSLLLLMVLFRLEFNFKRINYITAARVQYFVFYLCNCWEAFRRNCTCKIMYILWLADRRKGPIYIGRNIWKILGLGLHWPANIKFNLRIWSYYTIMLSLYCKTPRYQGTEMLFFTHSTMRTPSTSVVWNYNLQTS